LLRIINKRWLPSCSRASRDRCAHFVPSTRTARDGRAELVGARGAVSQFSSGFPGGVERRAACNDLSRPSNHLVQQQFECALERLDLVLRGQRFSFTNENVCVQVGNGPRVIF
jgi:hypothetical protein